MKTLLTTCLLLLIKGSLFGQEINVKLARLITPKEARLTLTGPKINGYALNTNANGNCWLIAWATWPQGKKGVYNVYLTTNNVNWLYTGRFHTTGVKFEDVPREVTKDRGIGHFYFHVYHFDVTNKPPMVLYKLEKVWEE